MLPDSALRDLLNFTSPDPVLSIYLNTDATEGSAEDLKLRLRALLKEVHLPEDEAAILTYFEHDREWKGRSLAMFSCSPQGFFQAFPLAVPVRSRVRVGNHPYVKPLADLLDAYGGYGVVLVDKQGARVFSFHLGELKEQEGMLGEDIRQPKRGGASSFPGRLGGISGRTRHTEEKIDRNIRDAIEFASHFFEQNHVRRILIGGTDDNVAHFRAGLSKHWQSLMVGVFPVSMNANHSEVLEKAMQVGQEAEHQREARLVNDLVTAAAKGGAGVVRLDDTLGALREGRIQMLVVLEGFRSPGHECAGCHYLTTQSLVTCPFCGGLFRHIPDAVEMAVRQVMQAGGDVEVVRDNKELENFGIGASLRY
jgi:peptide subunit release factor 1 (eRF1)